MADNKYFEAFGKPFPASDICWRLQYVDKEKLTGTAVPYLDARAIADRLDEVVGQNRWKNSYAPWHGCVVDKEQKSAQLCTIYIYDDELKEWIGKTDGAEDSDIKPVKGGLSDSFKRAAVRWNIGRYLYKFNIVWVKAVKRGRSYVIDSEEQPKLDKVYNDTVVRLFGNHAGNTHQNNQGQGAHPKYTAKENSGGSASGNANAVVYEVDRIGVDEDGKHSFIALKGKDKTYAAMIDGCDERLVPGARITNVKAEAKKYSDKTYIGLNAYDIAA